MKEDQEKPSGEEHVLRLARSLWAYHILGHEHVPSDAIIVLGSNDLRVAEWGAKLWLEKWAPLLVLSGGHGPLTRNWSRSEAEVFAEAAMRLGVPKDRMLLETRSTNTGENIRLTRRLLEERGVELERCLLVHKPYMERRSYATFLKWWPGKEARVTSPPVSFDDFTADGIDRQYLIHRLVGEVHRILEYPRRGYQAPQEVPAEVLAAFNELVALGYDRCLV